MTKPDTTEGAPDYDAHAFRRFERDGWSEVAGRYHNSFGEITAQAVAPVLDAVRLRRADRLLDLACGTGRLAAAAVHRGAQVTGLDISLPMVSQAESLCPDARFEVGDAEHLDFGNGVFDAVVCGFGVLHFPDAGAAMAEARRVLRSGGRIACSAWCPVERSPYLSIIQDALSAHGSQHVGLPAGPPAYQFGDPRRLEALLRDAGFEQVQCFEVPVMVRMADPSEVLTALFEGGVRSRKLLQAQTPEALARITEFAAGRANQFWVGERIEIPRPAMIGVGVK